MFHGGLSFIPEDLNISQKLLDWRHVSVESHFKWNRLNAESLHSFFWRKVGHSEARLTSIPFQFCGKELGNNACARFYQEKQKPELTQQALQCLPLGVYYSLMSI